MYIEALKKDFPMAYTVEAQTIMAEKAGGIEKLDTLFDAGDAAGSTENTLWIAAVMMKAYANREKLKCKILGEEYKGGETPTYEELRLLVNVQDLGQNFVAEISEAMKAGSKTTVEVKEEKRKNAKATP